MAGSLHAAAKYGHPKVVKLLLSEGADRRELDDNDQTPEEAVLDELEKFPAKHPKRARLEECAQLLSEVTLFKASQIGDVGRVKW